MNIRTNVDLKTLTTEQLQEMQCVLHGDMKAVKAQKKRVDAEIQQRAIQDEAARKLRRMSPAERAAAAQLLGASGISSGESVGTPGAR